MEIKQGDKVRVSKDAPKLYTRWYECDFLHCDSTVKCVESDSAEIERSVGDNGNLYYLTIPLKHLVKVEEEKKEPKYKVNDVVRTVFNEITHITSVLENGNYYLYGMGNEYLEESLTLVEPYTEPTEEKTPEVTRKSPSEKKYGSITIPVEVDLTDSFWATYTADLAKELAIAYGKRGKSPLDAVAAAKEIVKRLKQK